MIKQEKFKSILLGCFLLSEVVFAEPQIIQSSEQQTGLLELYTSEGCSSCPPADRWVSSLKNHDALWKTFVPLAFHVDYWDYIGWEDRFAAPEYSQRQRLFAYQQSLSTVYTPGFIFNGSEWRGWRKKKLTGFPRADNPGLLTLSIENGSVMFSFKPGKISDMEDLLFNIALLGFDIKTDVKRGENAGEELTHDFVVLDLKKSKARFKDGIYEGEVNLPKSEIAAGRYAVAAWLNTREDLSPIQATGAYLN